jgi:hypothetical protein
MDTLTEHAVVLAERGDEQAFLNGLYYGFSLGLLVDQRKRKD